MFTAGKVKSFNCLYNENGYKRKLYIDNYGITDDTFRLSIEDKEKKGLSLSIRVNLKELKAIVKFMEKVSK